MSRIFSRTIVKAVVFIAFAVGSAFVVNRVNNIKYESVSREMTEPELPLVYCELDGRVVNRMKGYTQVMSTGLMRDNVIPINANYSVTLLVDDENEYGSRYSYELRSIGGDVLIENGELSAGKLVNGYTSFNVGFRMDMKENREYVLVFIIENADGDKARYYTRIANVNTNRAREIIDYVQQFHSTTYVKQVSEEDGNMVYDKLRVTQNATDYDLSHVNLNSSYDMVSWGKLAPIELTALVPSIVELDKNYAVIRLDYIVQSVKDGVTHYYNINEYYNARYDESGQKVELLSFDRYQESIFDSSYISKTRNCISLGIAGSEGVEYLASPDNTRLAFVKEGQLFCYDYTQNTLVRVFDFQQKDFSDVRLMNMDVGIRIADIDEEGNICFAVFGYMSRGEHEGKNGISLFRYTAADSVIHELFFSEVDEVFDVMEQEIGRFIYYDKAGYFYYLLDNSIVKVDLNRMTKEKLVSGIPSDKYIVSKNRRVIAYPDSSADEDTTGIIIRDFEQGKETVVSGEKGDRCLALGFVENDLIYGVAKQEDIITAADNEAILPLYRIYMITPGGDPINEYSKQGIYIMNVRVNTDRIYLQRATKVNSFFETAEPDYIAYKHADTEDEITRAYSYNEQEMNVLDLVFPANMYLREVDSYIITKRKADDMYEEFSDKTSTDENRFYVFDNSGYRGEYKSAGRAILAVSEHGEGLVADSEGNTIYRNLDVTEYNTIANQINETPCKKKKQSLMTCAYMCIKYIDSRADYDEVLKYKSWEEAFSELTNGIGINISGIDLDTALYFLDRDVPFAACIDDGRYVLVISYNSTHIRYYDPMKGEEVKVTRKSFENSLSRQSNRMYTYTSQ